MYNSNYEEYMRNVLGYNRGMQNTYLEERDMYEINNNYEGMNLETLYPDIYRMIYPMVQKVCTRATGAINEELIRSMTDEVYNAMEEREVRQFKEVAKGNTEIKNNNIQSTRRTEDVRQNNFMLRDLIRILIIRELLRRRPGRPPMGRPPMRPPYPMM